MVLPKGTYTDEEPLAAALREFAEEVGRPAPEVEYVELGAFRYSSGKVVTVFAGESDFDPSDIRSNVFEIEWPPRSGRRQAFPELDAAEWFTPDDARDRLVKGQRPGGRRARAPASAESSTSAPEFHEGSARGHERRSAEDGRMRTITVTNNVSLDGVMQAPMSPDEDTRGGFPYGGWALAGNDEALAAELGVGTGSDGALLFGHRTYDHMAAYWPHQTDGNPFTEYMNRVEKFVASRHPDSSSTGRGSTLLAGEAADTVAALKQTDGPNLTDPRERRARALARGRRAHRRVPADRASRGARHRHAPVRRHPPGARAHPQHHDAEGRHGGALPSGLSGCRASVAARTRARRHRRADASAQARARIAAVSTPGGSAP